MGVDSLSRLIKIHQPRKAPADLFSLDRFEVGITLDEGKSITVFSLPGFKLYGCVECHQADNMVQKVANDMRQILAYLRREVPLLRDIPLKRFVIQPYASEVLKKNQFAHSTFDAIRVFPRTLIIDSNIYRNATLIHETLHLTQPFVGHPNELEAYAVNAQADPKFLLFNYRYFENVMQAFQVPDFQTILIEFFSRETKRESKIPHETQWHILPANESALERIAKGVRSLRPAINEAFRINRAQPLFASYWSERTGIPSLVFDLAAARLLLLPKLTVSQEMKKKAFQIFSQQFDKTDNTALGYVIDRKKETLMTLRYQHSLNDEGQGLALYFHYLKKKFFGKNGKLNLKSGNKKDFESYLEKKMNDIRRMANHPELSQEEKEAGLRLANWVAENIKK